MAYNQEIHWIGGLAPIADFMAGTVNTDVFECLGHEPVFIIYKGVGAVGTSTITIDACDDTTPTTTAAIPFRYRASTTLDTWGAWTAAAAAGFTTTAGSAQLYEIRVDPSDMAAQGYGYVRLHAVEVANDPVVGCVLAGLAGLRYREQPESLID
jgi:hypothetical protein